MNFFKKFSKFLMASFIIFMIVVTTTQHLTIQAFSSNATNSVEQITTSQKGPGLIEQLKGNIDGYAKDYLINQELKQIKREVAHEKFEKRLLREQDDRPNQLFNRNEDLEDVQNALKTQHIQDDMRVPRAFLSMEEKIKLQDIEDKIQRGDVLSEIEMTFYAGLNGMQATLNTMQIKAAQRAIKEQLKTLKENEIERTKETIKSKNQIAKSISRQIPIISGFTAKRSTPSTLFEYVTKTAPRQKDESIEVGNFKTSIQGDHTVYTFSNQNDFIKNQKELFSKILKSNKESVIEINNARPNLIKDVLGKGTLDLVGIVCIAAQATNQVVRFTVNASKNVYRKGIETFKKTEPFTPAKKPVIKYENQWPSRTEQSIYKIRTYPKGD